MTPRDALAFILIVVGGLGTIICATMLFATLMEKWESRRR